MIDIFKNSNFKESEHLRDEDGKFTDSEKSGKKSDNIKKEINSLEKDLDSVQQKKNNLKLRKQADNYFVRDIFTQYQQLKVSSIHIAQTGSSYFYLEDKDEKVYKVRVSDHLNQTSDTSKFRADLNIASNEDYDWVDKVVEFLSDLNIEPKGAALKAKKYKELDEKEENITSSLREKKDEYNRARSKEGQAESRSKTGDISQDERLKLIMDYIYDDKERAKRWEDLQDLSGSTGKNARRLFRREMEKEMEKKNAKQLPKRFYAKHMNGGLAGYDDETILVKTETMKNMCKSFEMKPVYVNHQQVDISKLESEAAGFVTRCFYNELDGWLWAEIIVLSDEGHEAVAKGLSVSNAYIPSESGEGGTCHDIPYDREILGGTFTHLAIVPNPRYEEACIMTPEEFKKYQDAMTVKLNELKNSKTKKGKIMFFKKTKVENPDEILNASFALEDGTEVTVESMIETIKNAKKNECDDKKEKVNMDMEVSVGDEKMSLKDLISNYQALNKENTSDEDKKEDKEESKNESDEDKKSEDKKEDKENSSDKESKENSKEEKKVDYFEQISNASAFGKMEKPKIALRQDALERGKKRY